MNENPENATGKSVRSDFPFIIDEDPDRAPGPRPPVQTFRSLSTEIRRTRQIGRRFRTFRSSGRRLEGRGEPFLHAGRLVLRRLRSASPYRPLFSTTVDSRERRLWTLAPMWSGSAQTSFETPTNVGFRFRSRVSVPVPGLGSDSGSRLRPRTWVPIRAFGSDPVDRAPATVPGRLGWIPVLWGQPPARFRRGTCSENATRRGGRELSVAFTLQPPPHPLGM
jgi:hypothetical protein